MARMLSLEASTIRGSIGGRTYLSNQFHQIVIRQRTAPVNPQTAAQTAIRAAFGASSVGWQQSSDAVRQGWQDYAQTLVYQGPLGPYSLPGRQVFLSNIALAKYLNARFTEPPVVGNVAPILPGFLSLSDVLILPPQAGNTGFAVNFLNSNPESAVGYSQRSFAFGPSRRRYKGPFLTGTMQVQVALTQQNVRIDFNGLQDGNVYWATLRVVSEEAPHRISTLYLLRAVAETVAP